jgi:hypothetical protein
VIPNSVWAIENLKLVLNCQSHPINRTGDKTKTKCLVDENFRLIKKNECKFYSTFFPPRPPHPTTPPNFLAEFIRKEM